MSTASKLTSTVLLLLGSAGAQAGNCQLTIEGNDLMQFSQRQLQVAADCTSVEVTLKHTGKQPIKVMGHDLVLAKTSDLNALVIAGMNAGLANNFLVANDPRIIAATPVIGGGESATIRFSTAKLQVGGDYAFFCTYPGHYALMKGAFIFGERPGARVASVPAAPGTT